MVRGARRCGSTGAARERREDATGHRHGAPDEQMVLHLRRREFGPSRKRSPPRRVPRQLASKRQHPTHPQPVRTPRQSSRACPLRRSTPRPFSHRYLLHNPHPVNNASGRCRCPNTTVKVPGTDYYRKDLSCPRSPTTVPNAAAASGHGHHSKPPLRLRAARSSGAPAAAANGAVKPHVQTHEKRPTPEGCGALRRSGRVNAQACRRHSRPRRRPRPRVLRRAGFCAVRPRRRGSP